MLIISAYGMILPALTLEQKTFCGLEEHVHTDECYEQNEQNEQSIICDNIEHTHDLMCYSNPEADIETSEVWENSVNGVELTGVWADDLAAIAKSQIGCTESSDNYSVNENNEIKGYSRYGAWYGNEYADWNGMFVSFCLNYAGIPQESVPYDIDAATRIEQFNTMGLYEDTSAMPKKGDLMFFKPDEGTGIISRTGIVSEIKEDADGNVKEINVIEGDVDNTVKEEKIDISSDVVAGYGKLPLNPALMTDDMQEDLQNLMPAALEDEVLSPLADPVSDPPVYYAIREENGETVIHFSSTPLSDGGIYSSKNNNSLDTPGAAEKGTCTKIVFDDRVIAPVDSNYFLANFSNATEIENISNLDTLNVTAMASFFSGNEKLKTIDVSNLNTSDVTNMKSMFAYCKALENIVGLENIDARKVTTMEQMFNSCDALKSVDLSGIETSSSLGSTSQMFLNCKALTEIKTGGTFTTEGVTDMSNMFGGCKRLNDIDATKLDTSSAKYMQAMFYECNALETLDLSGFNTAQATTMSNMFYNCYALNNLDFTSFNTANVKDMSNMFSGCRTITEFDLTSFNTGNVTNMASMFFNCEKLTKVDVSSFNTSNVTNMYRLFGAWNMTPVLQEVDLSNFDTSKVTNMNQMFINSKNLQKLDISGFNIADGTKVDGFFSGVDNLVELKTPASVAESVLIPLPNIMANIDDKTQVFGRMPRLPDITETMTLVPYETSLLTEGSESTLFFKKYLDGVLVNDPQRFEFGVFTEDGVDTGIRVNNDATGSILVETESLPLGRYYVQEIVGNDRVIYDNVKYYFTIEEETYSTQIVYPSSEVVYLPFSEDYLDTTKYDLVANAFSVTAYEKGTNNPVKTMAAYCADKSKRVTYGPVGGRPAPVYIDPNESQINTARGKVYVGPNKGELPDAIKCVLYYGDRYRIQEDLWDLLNFGVEVDTSNAADIPSGLKWAIIQRPNVEVQPLIVPLYTIED